MEEPQAVLGSRLHELAWPDRFREHVARAGVLELGSIAFANLANTRSVIAGTYRFHYYDEINGAAPLPLTVAANGSSLVNSGVCRYRQARAFAGGAGRAIVYAYRALEVLLGFFLPRGGDTDPELSCLS